MGGLLDKANAAKETDTEAKPVEPEPVVVKSAPEPVAKKTAATTSPSARPTKRRKSALLAGSSSFWGPFCHCKVEHGASLSLQWSLSSVLVPSCKPSVCEAASTRSNSEKSVVVALLIATTPYAAVMLVPTMDSMAISEVELDEDTNEFSFKVRGTMSSVDVSIEADGVEMWTGSGDVSNDMKKFKVPLSEFFNGNGEDYAGNEVVDYVIKGVGSNGQEGEVNIPSRFTTREAQDAGVRIAELHDSNDADEYLGITMEILVGLLGPNEDAEDGGGFSAVGLRPMSADYQVEVTVSGGDTWTESLITVDGDMATWAPQSGGTGSGSTSGWFGLTGSGTDPSGVYYLDKSEFYTSDGCYTFTVDITNTLGDQTVFSSEYSWNIDLNAGDGENSVAKGQGVGTTC